MSIIPILKQIPFFQSLSDEDQLSLVENIRLHYFPAGYTLFKQGAEADAMFIIRSGVVRIYNEEENFDSTITTLQAGDFFGEMALIENKPRNASAQILEDAELFELKVSDLQDLLAKKPEIAKTISDIYLERTQENIQNL